MGDPKGVRGYMSVAMSGTMHSKMNVSLKTRRGVNSFSIILGIIRSKTHTINELDDVSSLCNVSARPPF